MRHDGHDPWEEHEARALAWLAGVAILGLLLWASSRWLEYALAEVWRWLGGR